MILADSSAALGTVAVAALLFFGDLQVWHIYTIVVFSSMFSTFQEPDYMSSITMLVPKKDFARTNGTTQMRQAIGSITTPLLAGVLFALIGLKGIILIDLATFFIAVIPLFIVRIPQAVFGDQHDGKKKTVFGDFAIGWKFISTLSGLLGLLMYYAMVNLLLNSVSVLTTPMILAVHSAAVLVSVQTAMGMGMLVGGSWC